MGSKAPYTNKAIGKRDNVDDGVIEDSPKVDWLLIKWILKYALQLIKSKTVLFTVTLKTLFRCRQFNDPAMFVGRPEASMFIHSSKMTVTAAKYRSWREI